jgi:hypothetical protein
MKISFWYKNERRYILLRHYHNLWEILECLEKQYGESSMNVEYNKFVEENFKLDKRKR